MSGGIYVIRNFTLFQFYIDLLTFDLAQATKNYWVFFNKCLLISWINWVAPQFIRLFQGDYVKLSNGWFPQQVLLKIFNILANLSSFEISQSECDMGEPQTFQCCHPGPINFVFVFLGLSLHIPSFSSSFYAITVTPALVSTLNSMVPILVCMVTTKEFFPFFINCPQK